MSDGVHKHRNRWRAQIIREGRRYNLGAFATRDDALAARRAAELRFPDRGVLGRSARRYPAPPGMRACANPDCTHGPDGQRCVLPEDQFPTCGKYRKARCPACDRAASAAFKRADYRKHPDKYLARNRHERTKETATRHKEWVQQMHAAQHAIAALVAAGWTQQRIAATIGVSAVTMTNWKRGRTGRPRRTDAWNALIRLAAETSHGDAR